MLVFRPTKGEKSGYWVGRASYVALREEVAFGRIDCTDPPNGTGEGLITIGEAQFPCRIHTAGRARWAHMPADWVMYDGDARLHVARPESGRTYLVEGGDGFEALRLRMEGLGARFAIEPATDRMRIGEMIWTRAKLLPKPQQSHMALRTTPELPERLTMFLAWVGLQHWLRLGRD
jgi:hypothetical protein